MAGEHCLTLLNSPSADSHLNPDYLNAYYHLGRALFLQKRFDEAISAFSRIFEQGEEADLANLGLAQTYLEMGDLDQARKHLELSMLVDQSPIEISISCFIAAAEGDHEAALQCLERSYKAGLTLLGWYENDSNLSSVRGDPRFVKLLEQIKDNYP